MLFSTSISLAEALIQWIRVTLEQVGVKASYQGGPQADCEHGLSNSVAFVSESNILTPLNKMLIANTMFYLITFVICPPVMNQIQPNVLVTSVSATWPQFHVP